MEDSDYNVIQETYRVYKIIKKKTGKGYRVWRKENDKYTCTCPVFEYGGVACKHIKLILKLEGKIK